MNKNNTGIISSAYCLPSKIRYNDDQIFDWLHKNTPEGTNLFQGYCKRRVLSEGEDLMTIMLPASQEAIEKSGIDAGEIDFLLGTGSISEYRNPNVLFDLHRQLKLSKSCWVIPIEDEFSNFNSALVVADSLIKTGRARNILICIGGNWTRNVSYKTPQAISAADGAAAFIVGPAAAGESWSVKDSYTIIDSDYYGSMTTRSDKIKLDTPVNDHHELYTSSYFHINDDGLKGFKDFGVHAPPQCAVELLKKTGINSNDVCVVSHQASDVLTKAWNDVIKPAEYISTIKEYGNMALVNVPVNLAWGIEQKQITKSLVLSLTIGPDMHTNALLLEKNRG
ncbi:hypothetical protein [Maribellus sediminis]|uniref:hypothetical protein n=1 Tax=Maribellus sediminis TaxID=2696285 RepID=UPI00143224FE|nr:hypothetical protein [Maribellus sediminis]